MLLECLDPNSNSDIFRHSMVNAIVLGNGTIVNGDAVGIHLHKCITIAMSCFDALQQIRISKDDERNISGVTNSPKRKVIMNIYYIYDHLFLNYSCRCEFRYICYSIYAIFKYGM